MKKLLFFIIVLCAFMIQSCNTNKAVNTYGQTLSSAREISIQIQEQEFNDISAVNFFVGELARYFQSQGVRIIINRPLSHSYNCRNEFYLYVAFNYHRYLGWDGCWSWQYSDISFKLVDGCGNKRIIYIDDIRVAHTPGDLVKKFRKKLKNK